MSQPARRLRWLLLALGVLAAGLFPLLRAGAATPTEWAWRNEEHWAVDQMARDAVEMALAAAGRDPGPARIGVAPQAARSYALTVAAPDLPGGFAATFQLDTHLWNPDPLTRPVRDLLVRLGARSDQAPEVPVLEPLLTPTTEGLDRTGAALFRALTAHPGAPRLHEQAALVLGVFGLYDQSGAFQDQRPTLNRMAAHLALAAALRRGGPGPEGRLAEAALLILAGRNAQAAQALAGPAADLPPRWRTLLTLFATRDWRPVPSARGASLAEAMAGFRFRCDHQSTEQALAWVRDSGRGDLPPGYLARVAMRGEHYS